MWMDILGIIIGSVISIGTTIIIENFKKPDLYFQIEDPPIDMKYPNAPAKKARFLRVQLWNNDIKWLTRETAMHCNASIQVLHHDDLSPVFKNKISARWAGSDEPLSPQLDAKTGNIIQIFDPSKYSAAFRRNCHPGTKETIDVVVRFDDDDDCYIWTNDSYYKGWRNSEVKLPKGRYYIIVTVFSAGERVRGYFKLENTVGIKDFRLLALNEKERELIRKNY